MLYIGIQMRYIYNLNYSNYFIIITHGHEIQVGIYHNYLFANYEIKWQYLDSTSMY